MNQATMKGKWNQMKGDAKKKWGNLTDDDLQQVEGDHDKLVGKIQERYGKSKEEAEREVNDWHKTY
ncbi:CsbD family protein [Bacillus tianshenii]|uniref:CsbD family protein n=1 Tax=Sutcliffiella tianshenii TaxID=1463404 RepID=UPI001CD81199|nr:CsbD family protein [Bacillus tianshenii]MCA1321748.1 CsbD family protein [Bacillus tianshenii]